MTVNRPGSSITKLAYIDEATLVIEPYGGYAEQTLYLTYSDHGSFSGYDNVQITHRFELPAGSVINDMQLLIGNNYIQAKLIETWQARKSYDSVVNLKRDPAFLFKNNNQYELRIFPLIGGSFRKAIIKFITPVKWLKNQAYIDMPITALNAGNNLPKPLNLFFRYKEPIWGIPSIPELPDKVFSEVADSLGYHYKNLFISNTASLITLRVSYQIQLTNGRYFQSAEFDKGLNYFQYSLSLKDIFNLKADSLAKKNLIAIDLSGFYNKNRTELIPNLKTILKNALGKTDMFNIVVAGAGKIKLLFDSWQTATDATIDQVLNDFASSTFSDSIQALLKPRLLYADIDASNGWGFNGINYFATITTSSNLTTASSMLQEADICASFRHCFSILPETQLHQITANLDTFFINGGRFISYYNMDCNIYETVVKHYIPSINTIIRDNGSRTLYRDLSGNIGSAFPEYFDHMGNNLLQFNDPDVKVEVRDAQNHPAIISKKIGNGLLVATGIWVFNDDEATRRLLAMPILGLNKTNSRLQLSDLLNYTKQFFNQQGFDKLLLISNCDSLINKNEAEIYAADFITMLAHKPIINSINLLNDLSILFPSVTVNGATYTGSGYLLKALSDLSGGMHFERQTNDWSTISSILTPYSIPVIENLSMTVKGDGIGSNITDFSEIINGSIDPNGIRNFVGATKALNTVSVDIQAKFVGKDTVKTASFTDVITLPSDTLIKTTGTILGNEQVKLLLQQSVRDTLSIVSIAVSHRLLCDFTAFLVLAPEDSAHINNPDDPKVTEVKDKPVITDSTFSLKTYPNPFNSQVTFRVSVVRPSKITIRIYNILGEVVKTITENEIISGTKNYIWNTADYSSRNLSSGVYFVRIENTELNTGKKYVKAQKILLLK